MNVFDFMQWYIQYYELENKQAWILYTTTLRLCNPEPGETFIQVEEVGEEPNNQD